MPSALQEAQLIGRSAASGNRSNHQPGIGDQPDFSPDRPHFDRVTSIAWEPVLTGHGRSGRIATAFGMAFVRCLGETHIANLAGATGGHAIAARAVDVTAGIPETANWPPQIKTAKMNHRFGHNRPPYANIWIRFEQNAIFIVNKWLMTIKRWSISKRVWNSPVIYLAGPKLKCSGRMLHLWI